MLTPGCRSRAILGRMMRNSLRGPSREDQEFARVGSAGMADVQQSGRRGRQPSAVRSAMHIGACDHGLIVEVWRPALLGYVVYSVFRIGNPWSALVGGRSASALREKLDFDHAL